MMEEKFPINNNNRRFDRSVWKNRISHLFRKIWKFLNENSLSCQRLVAIACAMLSSFFLSLGYAISKTVNEDVDSLAIYAWRQTFLVFFTLPMVSAFDKPKYFHWREFSAWGQLVLRTIFGSLNVYAIFKAITYISLTDATVVSASAPVFCSILAYFILGETFGITEVVCSFFVIIGVILTSQPAWLFNPALLGQGDVLQRIFGLVIATASAICGALSTVLMRTMRSIHFSTVQIIYAYLSVLMTWPILAFIDVVSFPPCSFGKRAALTAIGFTALPMQAFYIIACQRDKAAVVSIARASTPVFSFIWQVTFFGQGLDGYSLIGDLVIMASIVALAVKKLVDRKNSEQERPETSKT